MGIGICIRDELGAFVLAKMEWFSSMFDLHVDEAHDRFFFPSLNRVHDFNVEHVDCELDLKKVVNSFRSIKHHLNEFGVIIAHLSIYLSLN